MPSKDAPFYRDRSLLAAALAEHHTWAGLSRATGVPVTTLKSAGGDLGVFAGKPGPRAGATVNGNTASVTSDPTTGSLGDIDALLRGRGLDPADWDIRSAGVSEWDSPAGDGTKLARVKVDLARKRSFDWVFPAVEVRERTVPKPRPAEAADRLVWLGGDEQAHYHDQALDRALHRWLADVQPDELVSLGDLLDFPTISRHPDRPSWAATAQECIDSGYRILSERRDLVPDAAWTFLRGNHDWRLESELLTRAERMFGIRPADIAGVESVPALSLRRLLHLDDLHIRLVGIEGDKWELARHPVAPGLVAQHQLPKAPRVTASIVAGHSHRQSIRQVTEWDENGENPSTRTLVEAGCLCQPRGGLGYASDPDWQQGFVTAAISADGTVGYDLAYWRDGRLTWRGETWKP